MDLSKSVMELDEWKSFSDVISSFWGEVIERTEVGTSIADDMAGFVIHTTGVLAYTLIMEARQGNVPADEKIEAFRELMTEAVNYVINRTKTTIATEQAEKIAKDFLSGIMEKQ